MRKNGKYTYDGPEPLYIRALEINKKVFGEEHPEIAENLNGLAQVFKHQFNYSKAEPMYLKSIEMTEKLIGASHPHHIHRCKNLADLYERWGRVRDAEKIHEKIKQLERLPKKQGDF
eukprot:TRINITY_DN2668_c0_g1_i3.p1 TRINITY_DN2668_c0_g1~~TRINITY_DN2668_c0_g1_i3.p1  ORF type:complete len:117 (-),score=24.95 TRINITY_DN2668_c0_g1_i3:374-724(-)